MGWPDALVAVVALLIVLWPIRKTSRALTPSTDCGASDKVRPGAPILWCPTHQRWEYDHSNRPAVFTPPPRTAPIPMVGWSAAMASTYRHTFRRALADQMGLPDCLDCQWETVNVAQHGGPIAHLRVVPCSRHQG